MVKVTIVISVSTILRNTTVSAKFHLLDQPFVQWSN